MSTKVEVEDFLSRAAFHVLDAARENIFVTDTAGRIVYFNQAASETIGYSLKEMAGRNIDALYRDKNVAAGMLEKIAATGEARVYEAVIIDRSGRERILSVKKSPLMEQDRRLVGFISVSRDVTEERLYEEELRGLKEFNEAVLNCSQDMITVTDVDGMVTYFNPAAERIIGYRKDEVLGRNISMFYREVDLALGKLKEIEADGQASRFEAIILDKQGREHLFSIHKSPLYDDDGRLIGFTATSRDVTEERRQEKELRQLKEFNEAVLRSVHDLVVVTDLDGRITYYNPKAEQTTGYSFEEVKGRRIAEFYKEESLSDEKLDFIKQTGQANSYQAPIVTKDGRERILEVNKAPLHDSAGQLLGFTAVSRDITRRLMAEEKVCQLEALLSEGSPVQVETALIHTRISEIMNHDFPFSRPDDTVASAAEKLIQHDLPALPVVGPAKDIIGVVSLKDLVEKGLFQGFDTATPVRELMRSDYRTIQPDTYYFDAMTAMVRGRSQMLPVTDGGHLRGILTMNDLMRSRGASVITVLEGIEEQTSLPALARFRGEVDRILASLVVEGALASQVTGIITEFNDRITRRVLTLCREESGPAPGNFAWLGLGSEGRKEQTLTTDQDNALIFEDAVAGDQQALDYFRRFSQMAVNGLDQCGFKLCPGLVMANNPKWSGGFSTWMDRIQSWVNEPTPQRTRDLMTFLDFRGLYGDLNLVARLREESNRIFMENPRFLTPMAEDTLGKGPPLGLFKRFLTERSGPHKGELNIKTQGTLVLIDCLRLLAAKEGLFATNTLERIHHLTEKEVFSKYRADSITEAYQTLMGLRLRNNVRAAQENREPSNYVNPERLPLWHQQRLRDAFVIAENLQKKVRRHFWWIN
jgi:CBS domain-containing protein